MHKKLVGAWIIGMGLIGLAGCHTATSPTNQPLFMSPASAMTVNQAVQNALIGSNDPVIAQVHVETIDNTVVLSGYVKKIRQSDTAEQLARQVVNGQNVDNRIIVRP